MESKMSKAVLCLLGFFGIVQGLSLESEKMAIYEPCWNYANCLSDGKATQKIIECTKILRPEDLQSVYHMMQDHYNYQSNNFFDAVKEFCKMDDANKPNVFAESLKGVMDYEKKVCADGSKKGACTRVKMALDCYLGELDQLMKQDKCQIAA